LKALQPPDRYISNSLGCCRAKARARTSSRRPERLRRGLPSRWLEKTRRRLSSRTGHRTRRRRRLSNHVSNIG
jgi:hypothetical protein